MAECVEIEFFVADMICWELRLFNAFFKPVHESSFKILVWLNQVHTQDWAIIEIFLQAIEM